MSIQIQCVEQLANGFTSQPEAEKAVLGALILDAARTWPEISRLLVPASFVEKSHQQIFQAIKKLMHAGQPVDVITLDDALMADGLSKKTGGLAYLSELAQAAIPANAKKHARIVLDASIRRQALAAHEDFIAGRCNLDELAQTHAALSVAANTSRALPVPRRFTEIAMAERIRFSFALPGLRLGNVGVFAGYGGIGKGFLGLAIAIDTAMGEGELTGLSFDKPQKVFFISIEDDQEALDSRLQAYAKHLNPRQRDLLDQNLSVVSVYGLPDWQLLKRNERGGLVENIPAIAALAEAAEGAGLILLDTARKFFQFDENKSDEASLALYVCDQLARKTGAAVVVIHHLVKPTSDRKDEMPDIFAIRGSSALVADARWAAILANPPEGFRKDKGLSLDRKYRVLDVGKVNHAGQPAPILFEQDEEGALVWREWPAGRLAGQGNAKPVVRADKEYADDDF